MRNLAIGFYVFVNIFLVHTPSFSQTLGPDQPPVLYFPVEWCEGYYNDLDYQRMKEVSEIPEARTAFPGSYMFVPADGLSHPGVLSLHGSEGGRWSVLSMCDARYFASKGYAALFLCYSDCGTNSLPESIFRIDLKRTYDAMLWLKGSEYVAGKKVGLAGVSRGAEQALNIAVLLSELKARGENIVLPDAVFTHAPYGRIVGAFNWRWANPAREKEWRWNSLIGSYLRCMLDDPQGPYTYTARDGKVSQLSWDFGNAACTDKPAFLPTECRIADPNGPYVDTDTGVRWRWEEALCGVAPDVNFDWRKVPAWTWDGSTEDLIAGDDVYLQKYPGPVLVSQGTKDSVWPFDQGSKYLMQTLDRNRVQYFEYVLSPILSLPSPMPSAPHDRLVFASFEGEEHGYSQLAAEVELSVAVSFWGLHLAD